ncbi:MAG: hypothetical protein EPN53_12190, partial [Acidobacteria bacterium]
MSATASAGGRCGAPCATSTGTSDEPGQRGAAQGAGRLPRPGGAPARGRLPHHRRARRGQALGARLANGGGRRRGCGRRRRRRLVDPRPGARAPTRAAPARGRG